MEVQVGSGACRAKKLRGQVRVRVSHLHGRLHSEIKFDLIGIGPRPNMWKWVSSCFPPLWGRDEAPQFSVLRGLPENFNESRYIFVSVLTTAFLWLVFLPTYLTAQRASYRAVLLGACLTLNAGVTLLCLFAPKLYAIYCVDEQDMQVSINSASFGRFKRSNIRDVYAANRLTKTRNVEKMWRHEMFHVRLEKVDSSVPAQVGSIMATVTVTGPSNVSTATKRSQIAPST